MNFAPQYPDTPAASSHCRERAEAAQTGKQGFNNRKILINQIPNKQKR